MSRIVVPSLFDRLFADFEGAVAASPKPVFQPSVDVVEFEDRFEVVADLPGFAESEIEVRVEEGQLSVRGERSEEVAPEGGRLLRRERRGGAFARRFALGRDADVDNISASFRNGVLRVSVPKGSWAQPRVIPVH